MSTSHNSDNDDERSLSIYSECEGRPDDKHVDEEGTARPSLAEMETRAVQWSKLLVFVVLLTAASAVTISVYLKSSRTEEEAFQDTFEEYTEQIISTVHRNAQSKLEAVGAIALQIQAYAITEGKTWPNVTVPFFEEHIMATQSLTDAYGVQLFPVVTNETRAAWEEYSVENRGWLNDSYAAQRHTRILQRIQSGLFAGISNKIFGTTFNADKHPIIDPSPGPFFPQWQTAAASWYYQTTVNSNYGNFEDFFNQTQIVMETSTAAYGMAWSDGNVPGYISTMLYPIFDSFYGTNGTTSPQVVAFTAIDLYWQAFIERILPPGADGIYVVMENAPPCDQSFTFEIRGNIATFVDDGDQHEVTPEFDAMKTSFVFGSPLMEPIASLTYTGRPLYDDFCPYTFHIYPSQELKDKYVTTKPMWYAVIVCGVFLFTSLVFLTYDWLVERRQRLVLSSANEADAVVSSLFPSSVKERLYENERTSMALKQQQQQQEQQSTRYSSGGAILKNNNNENTVKEFMGTANPNNKSDSALQQEVSPIAELYPETTIMFADLVGFTSWSANRQPNEVFVLLETLYGLFDAAAARRGVFKVETIGDCYVAVTGLPKPQEQHALIMVKFADDCRLKMRQELHSLAETLGPKTLDLALRTGCIPALSLQEFFGMHIGDYYEYW
ncbi:stable enterotoxin receptor [Seminavis robusta]|uniref:Stable enterotoxin receptor n=1 Tax=Seminavis robusta TaxID=568900 RepID=A0A9N8HQ35_9STRA|nr:stable enterotoxin receptor [Seminavis robusta]|eukprot:Sro1244_g255580.1 stable enterotoxin receptor (668) ;mRNA; r:8558-11386